jgi:hypothetical protein
VPADLLFYYLVFDDSSKCCRYCVEVLASLPFTSPDEPLYLVYDINRFIQIRAGAIESNLKNWTTMDQQQVMVGIPGYTGDVMHEPGQTGDVMHEPGQTGDVMHEPGQTGDVMHEPGDTGDVMHGPGDTGDVTHGPGDTGDVMHEPVGYPDQTLAHIPQTALNNSCSTSGVDMAKLQVSLYKFLVQGYDRINWHDGCNSYMFVSSFSTKLPFIFRKIAMMR